MSEEVLELSVDETNALRAKLGLKPLRLNNGDEQQRPSSPSSNHNAREGQEELLEMSVSDTNALREKLGLPPLRDSSSNNHRTQVLEDAKLQEKEAAKRRQHEEEQAKLQRQVQKGTQQFTKTQSLGQDDTGGALDWATKMRQSQQAEAAATTTTTTSVSNKKKKKPSKTKGKQTKSKDDQYDQEDLKGIQVAHAMSELEAGSTTVMTLADAPLLETDQHHHGVIKGLNDDGDGPQLENVNLTEAAQQSDGLRRKRQVEMGMGRAGGYAGFDDDEFVELGGSSGPSRMARGQLEDNDDHKKPKKRKGFQIGGTEEEHGKKGSDLFAAHEGRAISLEASRADVQASDFMTEQEEMELRELEALSNPTVMVKKKKSKKDKKKEKKERKKQRKEHKKHLRRRSEDSGSEDDDSDEDVANKAEPSKSLLDELEETAHDEAKDGKTAKKRKRRSRDEDDDEDENIKEAPGASPSAKVEKPSMLDENKGSNNKDKRAKYDEIMAKGNYRTQKAFEAKTAKAQAEDDNEDGEPDDAFLNAALAKARRMNKLRQMAGGNQQGASSSKVGAAEAVAESVQSMQPDVSMSDGNSGNAGVTFSIDDTREFTRALRARTEQKVRQQTKAAAKPAPANAISTVDAADAKKAPEEAAAKVTTVKHEDDENDGAEDMDMSELAKEIKDDELAAGSVAGGFLDGSTGNTVAVGRGLANVMNLWKHTGELTRKNAGKEELRGRAKDERTYEDYEALNLKEVVKIDESRATDKDREFANREIKLEYRDKHGRLLTRKEAYRDLCYQFHGHGSSKRKEEKRQQQVAREQAEARLASQQVSGGPGTFGALKKTQKATGKAFVVHKT